MKVSDFKPYVGKRVKLWSKYETRLYAEEWLSKRPTWTGILTAINGRNITLNGDYIWIPDIARMEVESDKPIETK